MGFLLVLEYILLIVDLIHCYKIPAPSICIQVQAIRRLIESTTGDVLPNVSNDYGFINDKTMRSINFVNMLGLKIRIGTTGNYQLMQFDIWWIECIVLCIVALSVDRIA